MTGFGKVTAELSTKKLTIEIKALNSKQLDIYTRLPQIYREKEMELRALLFQGLGRGKVEFSISVEDIGQDTSVGVNRGAIEQYYQQLREIADDLGIVPPTDWLQVLLRLPDIVKTDTVAPDEKEWQVIIGAVEEALQCLREFRRQEGEMLEILLKTKIDNIGRLLKEIEHYEGERIERVKTRISDNLEKISTTVGYDKNRFEQEFIFYIEKLDISEEKSRLSNHLAYFVDTIEREHTQGRKLGFIAQEIGREINTLGSKSNHAEMQKLVVQMKDELEQIKEQILNIL
jgi:uncharacterized protein (TIGR00255 family)